MLCVAWGCQHAGVGCSWQWGELGEVACVCWLRGWPPLLPFPCFRGLGLIKFNWEKWRRPDLRLTATQGLTSSIAVQGNACFALEGSRASSEITDQHAASCVGVAWSVSSGWQWLSWHAKWDSTRAVGTSGRGLQLSPALATRSSCVVGLGDTCVGSRGPPAEC